ASADCAGPETVITAVFQFVLLLFFQAKDGIRDDLVTGVQTCALPICRSHIRIRPWLRRLITRLIAIVPAALTAIFFGESGTARRSEERRVGKECRARWGVDSARRTGQ